VRTVLRPHDGEHGKLRVIRLAPELLGDQFVLVVGEPKRPVEWFGLHAHAGTPWRAAVRSHWNTWWPPVGPRSGSTACSGWGIIPTTFPRSLRTPAMACALPFGLNCSSRVPSGAQYRNATWPPS